MLDKTYDLDRSQPLLHQQAREIQPQDAVTLDLPLGLSADVRQEVVQALNKILADTIALRDLYKKCHWQVAGPTFYQLHLLFDKHYEEQEQVVDEIAERIQILGGISIAVAHDVVGSTILQRPPRGREEVPVQLSRLLEAHETMILEVRSAARRVQYLGDDGTNDLLAGSVLRKNEKQVWFLYEHLVSMPLVVAK